MPEGMKGALPAYLPKGRDNSMTRDETYNGWTNWETWLVYTRITSEESSYKLWIELAKRYRNQYELGNHMKAEFEKGREEVFDHFVFGDGDIDRVFLDLSRDFLQEAFHSIDYYEVASHILDEALGEEV